MANATSTQLQELYVAYFGRAADPTGLDYWTAKGITTSKFAADMYAQLEFKDAYGSLSVEAQVNQIYKNLFDREADVTGLTYWTQQINLGNLQLAEIANDLIWAAQNNSGSSDDKTALTNRTNAAVAYTAEVKESTAAILAYAPTSSSPWTSGANITEAISYLSGIDKDTAHTAAGITASVSTITTNGVQSASATGKTYTLTTAQDAVTGTTGNDSIQALGTTLTSGDTVDGGAGTDTLSVSSTIAAAATLQGFTLTNVEKLTVALAEGDATAAHALTVNTLNSSATTLEASGLSTTTKSDGVSFTNVASGTKLALTSATDVDLNATYVTAATSGTADSVSLTVSGAAATAATDGIVTIATGFETVNVATTGSASSLGDLITTTGTTFNITGDQNLTIGSATVPLDDTLVTLDASAFTGALTAWVSDPATHVTNPGTVDLTDVTITGGSGNDAIGIQLLAIDVEATVDLGAGDDSLTIAYIPQIASSTLTADSYSGGAGTDRLISDVDVLDYAAGLTGTTTIASTISGFEVLALNGFTTEDNVINPANISADITTVSLEAAATGSRTQTINVPGDFTVQVLGSAITAADTIVVDSGAGTSDSLIFKNANLATGTNQLGDEDTNLTTTDFETVTIDTGSYSTATAQLMNAVNVGTNTLKIIGSNPLTLKASTGIVTATTLDASGATGALTMNAAAAEGIATITGGSGSDTLKGDVASTISGGAGNDIITGGTGNDTLNGGAGNDSITTNTGSDAVTGGAGNDTAVFGANLSSLDTFDGGDGTDVISITNASITTLKALTISEANTFNTGFNNVENLLLTESLDSTSFDLGYLDSIVKVTIPGHTDAETLSGFDSGDTLAINAAANSAADILTLSLNSSSTGTTDVLNVVLEESGTADYGVVAIANVETINLSMVEDTASTNVRAGTVDLTITQTTGGAAQTLNITGTESLTIGTATAVGTIDASGMTVVAAATEAGLTMSAAHTKAQTITGSGKVDTLYGSTKADTISGGAGADIIHPGTGADTVDGGAGTDVFHTTSMVASSIEGAGTGTSTGVVINLGSTAIAGSTITAYHGEYLGNGVSSVSTGQVGYVFDADLSTNSGAITTLSNIESLTLAANGLNYVVGSSSAETITGGSSTDYIHGGDGNDIISGLAAIDTIVGGLGADIITPGTGADIVTLTETTASSDTVTIATGDSSTTAYDAITGFAATLANADKLTNSTAAFDVTANVASGTAINVAGAVTGTGIVTAYVTSGIISLAGNDTADVNTIAEWAGVAAVANVIASGDTAAFEFSGDTYVFHNPATGADSMIRLVGLTGVTALSDTAAAADTIFVG